MDYGDVIYAQPNNYGLLEKIEFVQYNVALTITGAIRGISKVKLYQELGLDFLQDKRWMKLLYYLHIIVPLKLPTYLCNQYQQS